MASARTVPRWWCCCTAGRARVARLIWSLPLLRACWHRGFDVLRVNLRDHGDSHHLNRELFNSTRSPEVASALQGFVDERDYRHLFLVGFSLGGSFALRVAADAGAELGVSGLRCRLPAG